MARGIPDTLTARRSNSTGSLVLASISALLASLDVTLDYVAFPSISSTFDTASYSSLSWVLNSDSIVFAARVRSQRA